MIQHHPVAYPCQPLHADSNPLSLGSAPSHAKQHCHSSNVPYHTHHGHRASEYTTIEDVAEQKEVVCVVSRQIGLAVNDVRTLRAQGHMQDARHCAVHQRTAHGGPVSCEDQVDFRVG